MYLAFWAIANWENLQLSSLNFNVSSDIDIMIAVDNNER